MAGQGFGFRSIAIHCTRAYTVPVANIPADARKCAVQLPAKGHLIAIRQHQQNLLPSVLVPVVLSA